MYKTNSKSFALRYAEVEQKKYGCYRIVVILKGNKYGNYKYAVVNTDEFDRMSALDIEDFII